MDEKETRPERSVEPEPPRGTRFAGESSSGNEPVAPSHNPSPDPEVTRIDVGLGAPDPGATMDLDATCSRISLRQRHATSDFWAKVQKSGHQSLPC
jgi:hypothetical protein